MCDVTPEGLVRAFDSSKGAAVRLWIDNEVATIPLVGGIMKKALEKALFNDKINVDTMDTDEIIAAVEAAFGSDSVLAKYIESYKGELVDSLRKYLDKVNTVISCTLYDGDGKVLATDSFEVCVQKARNIGPIFFRTALTSQISKICRRPLQRAQRSKFPPAPHPQGFIWA